MSIRCVSFGVAALCAAGAVASSASGAMLVVSANVGSRSAEAKFEAVGTNLIVTLTNTSMLDAMVPVDVLTAVFYDINPAMMLTRTSAVVAPGSSVFYGPTDPGGVVGGEWAYVSGLSGAPANASLGISSSGFGLFGPGDRFPGSDLQPPASPDGLQYGITTAGDNLATGNTPMTGSNALIKNSVIFTLSGIPLGFDPSTQISNVSFQYGTDLSEPNIPAPAGVVLAGLVGLTAGRRRR